jgi:hypothetical protein
VSDDSGLFLETESIDEFENDLITAYGGYKIDPNSVSHLSSSGERRVTKFTESSESI